MSFNLELTSPPLMAILSSLIIWTIGALLSFVIKGRLIHQFFAAILFAGAFLLGIAVVLFFQHNSFSLDFLSGFYFALAPLSLHLDALNCFFLGILSVTICLLSISLPKYLHYYKERFNAGIYWHCLFAFILSLVFTLLSVNAICFLIFWEIMSLTVMMLIASDHIRQRAKHAALSYLAMTIISSVLITGAFLIYYFHYKSWNFSDWTSAGSLLMPALLLFFGLGVKCGIWPFQIWMAHAQSEAPAPVTALMSAVMKKVSIYAIIRLLIINNDSGVVLAYVILAFGTVSLVWGSLFALLERDLKRLLSFSTVENIGLILIALGLCLMARHLHCWDLANLALTAALFHSFSHALSKTGLFIGANGIEAVTYTRDLSFLGGLAGKMPWTTACFLINSMAIIALPPASGFASKWMIYQGLFQLATSHAQVVDRSIALIIVGIMSFAGALALACYTKAIGICFLGRSRSDVAGRAGELLKTSMAAQFVAASASLILGVCAPYIVRLFQPVCLIVLPKGADLHSVVALPLFTTVLLSLIFVGSVLVLLNKLSLRPRARLKKYITWDCGYGDLPARAEETGASFSESIARIFAPILQYRMITEIQGKDRRHFPEVIKFETVTSPLLEEGLYRPTLKIIQILSRGIAALQTGSIHLYLVYVFITLVVLVSIGIRL